MALTRYVSAAVFSVMTAASLNSAFASVQIGTTRVIYHAKDKDVSVPVTNPGSYPVLLQNWVDDGNPELKPDNIHTPFVLTPPLARVNAGQGQTLRLSFIGSNLPADRESIYWLNVLEIPPVNNKDKNQMQVAFRSRIKIFYRPEALNDKDALESAAQVRWQVQGKQITLTNPTPYFVSALAVTIQSNGKKFSVPADMIAPKSSKSFSLPQPLSGEASTQVSIETINDFGATASQLIKQ